MICIIAGNKLEAQRWASGQNLSDDEWFFPYSVDDLERRTNFHVVVVGTAGQNIPPMLFERIYSLAKRRGRMK